MDRVVFMKQSGESLAGSDGTPFDEESIHAAAVQIKLAHDAQKDLGILGITIVAGGGNILRGGENASLTRDAVGKLATFANTLVLQGALHDLNVPTELFTAPGVLAYDRLAEVSPLSYQPGRMLMAHEESKVALLGFGMGKNRQTTDAAVVQCAASYADFCQSTASAPQMQPTILKATRYDGIFEADPATHEDAVRYRTIGAPTMLADYERFAAVDHISLGALIDHNLSMAVYSGEHSLVDALQEDYTAIAGKGIGTLIMPHAISPTFYRD